MTVDAMAEFTVRVVREGDETRMEVVIYNNQVVAEGKNHPISLYGHGGYSTLFTHCLEAVRGS